ncbi:MAG TPA: DUF4443 domain-containing protein [Nitrososphaeraceae archaeon]|nr:DUF4443 domain-containing protein [Nitrososphaeraceae archaeon]
MHTYVRLLEKVSNQYSPARQLSFSIGHIFKALQLANLNGHISRDLLRKELSLGEGSIKTLIKHLKTTDMIKTSNAGTTLSEKGKKIVSQILQHIPKETIIPKSSITVGKFNYAVLVKNIANSIRSGIEQRDIAIKSGAIGATTLIFKDGKFLVPKTNFNALEEESKIQKVLVRNLGPNDNDVIIIGSDNTNKQNAEIAAKNAALFTIMNHLKH